jgi:hypothetical protein
MESSGADNSTNTTPRCFNCLFNLTTLRCACCKVIFFCSRECQKQAWKAHKAFCKAVANPTQSTKASVSTSTSTCLIVDGMVQWGSESESDYMKCSREELLFLGVHVCVINAGKGRRIPEQVASLLAWNEGKEATFRSILIVGFGNLCRNMDLAEGFTVNPFREASVSWVQKGGNFLVQGEKIAEVGQWPAWFGKTWRDGADLGSSLTCFARPSADANGEIVHWCKWYHKASGAITKNISAKAFMLQDVPDDEILFGTDPNVCARAGSMAELHRKSIDQEMAAVAFGKCGEGTVSFFGDVNHEDETVRTIAIIARGFDRRNEIILFGTDAGARTCS